jgi:hypothetical protein
MKKNPTSRQLMVLILWSCAALLITQLTASAQTLTHRYEFWNDNGDTNAVDAVGTANGILLGDLEGTAISGGHLELDGSGYVLLPAGIITNDQAVTVEAWGDYPSSGQGTWANLFDFGTPSKVDTGKADSHSISFCVNVGTTGDLDAALSDFDDANVQRENCYAPGTLLAGTTGGYIAAVFDPPAGYISVYFNGTLQSTIPITETITPGVIDNTNWIGWDNWPDPSLTANIDEFRIWNGALNSFDIAASYQNGFSVIDTNAGTVTGIEVSAGPQVVSGGQEISTVLATASLITNSVDVTALASYSSGNTNIIVVGTNGFIHGIDLGTTTVTASYGGKSNSVTVTVIPAVSVLAHRYSFNDTGTTVKDSIGTLDGNLMGTAVETNGQVVLDGSVGCYVDLGSNSFANDGIITGYQSATVDYWATFGTLQNWNYAWAFGNSAGYGFNYIHNVVRNGNTGHRIDDNAIAADETIIDMLGTLANETVHCTTVINPTTGVLAVYTNGVLSGLATNDYQPLSDIATNFIYVGRSLWTAVGPGGAGDPYLAGSIDEIRVYNGALTPQQIAVADLNGPNNTNISVGALQSIQVSIPTLNLGDTFLGGTWANYANLTNYNLLANSQAPLLIYTSSDSNVVYQGADGKLLAVGLGSATITANYGGFTGSQLVGVVHAPVLVNRYSFQDAPGSTNVADSVGGPQWDGILPNGGTFTGTNLQLLGSGPQYVQLPSGILKNYPAVTIDLWLTFPDQMPVNCMLFAFGNTDAGGAGENYIFCAPQGGRIAISGVDPGYDGEQGCTGAGDLSFQQNIHLTAVFDPPAGAEYWYTNGVLVSSNLAVTIPMSYVDDVTNFICHSIYTADPHEDINISEFRIYNGALSAADVAAEQALGPSQLLTSPTSLTHRYSFNDSGTVVQDSVGTLNGNLMGTAHETGGQVVLDGSVGCYVDLGSNSFANDGIISGYQSTTIDYWATMGTLQNWNYAWAFGNSAGYGFNYVHNVVRNGNTGHRIDNSTSAGSTVVDMLGDFANETVHCTTVIDPLTGVLAVYTNGVLSGSSTSDFEPLNTIATNFIYIGRSLWTAVGPTGAGDPYLAASIDELRVYNGVLTPQQIAVADLSGPNNTNVTVGALQSIQVSIPQLNLGDIFAGGLIANYANLTNYNLVANSPTPLSVFTSSDSNIVYQAADGKLHAVGVGSATISANYGGLAGNQLVTVVYAPTLVNRYSFHDAPGSTTVADSVGGPTWDGTLPSGGTFTGTNLVLLGTNAQYVQLPSGILSNYPAVTVDLWASFPTQMPVNCQLYAFGNTDSTGAGENYIFCAPQGGRIAITGVDPGYAGEQGTGGAGDLSFQQNIHVTSVYDPPAGIESLYTNGVLVSQNTAVTVPMSYVDDVINYIGHSLYTGDPHEDLTMFEFRIYKGALSPADVATSQALGPSTLLGASAKPGLSASFSVSSGNFAISWPVSGSTGFSLYSSSSLGAGAVWTLVNETPTVVGQNYEVSIPINSSVKAQFYELKN